MRMGWLFGVVGLAAFAVAKPAAAQVSVGASAGVGGTAATSQSTASTAQVTTNQSTTATTTTTTTTTTTAPAGSATTPAATEGGEVGDAVPASEKEKEEEARLSLALDMVLGFGKQETVTQNLPGPTANSFAYNYTHARTTSESFIASLGYEVGEHGDLGLRLPFSHGTLFPADSDSRDAFALGNLELEGAYKFIFSDTTMLVAGLGIALPTSQGADIGDPEHAQDNNTFAQSNADRYSVNHFAAASRGWEENALFETNRTGIVPKLTLLHRSGRLAFEPYVKVENLIRTSGSLENTYIGEFLIGGRLAYRVADSLSLGVRAWANVPFHNDPGVETVGVVEPEMRLHFGNVEPYAGVILPFAGPLDDPYIFGVRLGIAARL